MEFITTDVLESMVCEVKDFADTHVTSTYTVYGSDSFEWEFRADNFDQYTTEDLVEEGADEDVDPNATEDTRYVRVSDVVEKCEEDVEFDTQEVIYTRDIFDIYNSNTDECDSAFTEYCYDTCCFNTPSEAISASVGAFVHETQRRGIEEAVSGLVDRIS